MPISLARAAAAACVATAAFVAPALAAPDLVAGNKAPELETSDWVKGQEVTEFEPGKIYVVEFWATWCPPCIASMPHLTKLQTEYKDDGVTIIGISSLDSRGNTLEAVETMTEDKGDELMGYSVAFDDSGVSRNKWQRAADSMGLPTAFVVDREGKIAFIGHPMVIDFALEGVVAGNWDMAMGDKLDALLFRSGDMQKAENRVEFLEQLTTDFPRSAVTFGDTMGQMLMSDYAELGREDEVWPIATRLIEKAIKAEDADKLNELSWMIVAPGSTWQSRDLDLAMRAAVKAVEFSKGEDASILDTLARVHAREGNFRKAIEVQQQAINKAEGWMKDSLTEALTEYKQAAGLG
ncbi:MAG: redoxin domain-containing protein [Planctomycetota bacterium]